MAQLKIGLLVVAILFAFLIIPVTAHEVPGHVVISEVQIADNEFVELYNPTSSEVSMDGWYWSYFPSNYDWNNPTRNKKFPDGATIPSHGFFLVGLEGYPEPTSDWQVYSSKQLSNTAGSVGIFPWDPSTKTAEEAKNGRIDAVGWGSVEYVNETLSAAVPDSGKSIERKHLVYGYAPCQDTNNNSEDFEIKTPTPMNSSFSMSPVPPPPDHIVISEVYPDPKVAYDTCEFVELYNPTGMDMNLNGWVLEDNDSKSCTIGGTIPSHGFYLIGYSDYNNYKDNPNWPDADELNLPYYFLANGGDELRLKDSSSNIIDTVGYGSAAEWNETLNTTVPGAGESIERKSLYEGYAPCQDTNNNSEDFDVKTPTPKNSSFSMDPVPPPVSNPVPVPEFSATGLLALILILGIVLVVMLRRDEK